MYGENRTPQWHFGNGPDHQPTSINWSGDDLRQGETAANVFFNNLAARLYRAFMKILDGRGVLFGLKDDVNIACPPEVLGEIVVKLPELAMSECGLTTQATKNRVYVQPSTRAAWIFYLGENPRTPNPLSFSIHDFPDGRNMPTDEYDPSGPIWPNNDGINILGTPYGSPKFVEEYLQRKLAKHE